MPYKDLEKKKRKAREHQARYRERHPERVKASRAKWIAKNRPRQRKAAQKWRAKNAWAVKLCDELGIGITEARRLIYNTRTMWGKKN